MGINGDPVAAEPHLLVNLGSPRERVLGGLRQLKGKVGGSPGVLSRLSRARRTSEAAERGEGARGGGGTPGPEGGGSGTWVRWLDLRTKANHAIFQLQSRVGRYFREFLERGGHGGGGGGRRGGLSPHYPYGWMETTVTLRKESVAGHVLELGVRN